MTDKEIDTHVGKKIRAYRKFADMSQSDLAEHLDVRFQQLQKYENATNRISASKLWRVSKALNQPVSAFFDGLPADETTYSLSDTSTWKDEE